MLFRWGGHASEHADRAGDDAPDFKAAVFGNLNVLVGGVLRLQPDSDAFGAIALDCETAIEQCKDDCLVLWRSGAIDHGNVARKDTRTDHAVADDPHRECRRPVFHQQFVEIEWRLQVIVGRAREARRHT